MDPTMVTQFAKYGGYIGILTGVMMMVLMGGLGVLWRYVRELQKALNTLQEKRVEEAKEVRALLMELSEESNKAIGGLTEVIRTLRETLLASHNRGR